MIKPFDGFAIKKTGQLTVVDFGGYETRNESTITLIKRAIEKHDVPDFDWVLVNTGDETIAGKTPTTALNQTDQISLFFSLSLPNGHRRFQK